MIPLYDDNPRHRPPLVTVAIIVLCCLVFVWELGQGENLGEVFNKFGLVGPYLLGEGYPFDGEPALPAWMTIFTSMFLHGGFFHLLGNMWFLWIFGDNVEDALGSWRFLLFYLAAGIAAGLTQVLLEQQGPPLPMVGASGAIGGVLGAYLLLYPRANVNTLVPIFFFITVMRLPAFIVLGIWLLLQFVGVGQPGQGVAYWAHLGGFLAGVALIFFIKRGGVRLFAPARSRAFESHRSNMGEVRREALEDVKERFIDLSRRR